MINLALPLVFLMIAIMFFLLSAGTTRTDVGKVGRRGQGMCGGGASVGRRLHRPTLCANPPARPLHRPLVGGASSRPRSPSTSALCVDQGSQSSQALRLQRSSVLHAAHLALAHMAALLPPFTAAPLSPRAGHAV